MRVSYTRYLRNYVPEKEKYTPQCVVDLDPLSHTHAITRSHQVRELRVESWELRTVLVPSFSLTCLFRTERGKIKYTTVVVDILFFT